MQHESVSGWVDVGAAEDVVEGEVKGVKVNEQFIALYRIDGQVHATSDVCTHDFALLSGGWIEAGVVECPLHGARFNVVDGRCLGPYGHDLRCFRARQREGRVEVALPDEGQA